VTAYNSNQELLVLTELLKSGERPHLVIFYDGGNDTFVGGLNPADPMAHGNLDQISATFQGHPEGDPPWRALVRPMSMFRLARLLRDRISGQSASDKVLAEGYRVRASDKLLRKRAARTLMNWDNNRRIVAALSREFSFKCLFVWQPVMFFGSKPLSGAENAMAKHPELLDVGTFDPVVGINNKRIAEVTYEAAERRYRNSDSVLFLGDAFGGVGETVYIDWVHLAPRGNQIVAARIADCLERLHMLSPLGVRL
jgi:lysophospholipase L1-like esterase